MSAIIHPFTMDCYDEVYALWELAEGVCVSEADSRANILAYLRRNPNMSYVARDGLTVVGAVLGGHDGRRGILHHLAVLPEYRKQGIGRILVEHSLAAQRAAGIARCYILVLDTNDQGLRFWETIGWQPCPEIHVMTKDIA